MTEGRKSRETAIHSNCSLYSLRRDGFLRILTVFRAPRGTLPVMRATPGFVGMLGVMAGVAQKDSYAAGDDTARAVFLLVVWPRMLGVHGRYGPEGQLCSDAVYWRVSLV